MQREPTGPTKLLTAIVTLFLGWYCLLQVLCKHVHKLHHYDTNPSPLSALAMHSVEHLLCFSGVLIHILIPAHPDHFLFQSVQAGLLPVTGHLGFDKIVLDDLGEQESLDTHPYTHYLLHKYFECNYANSIFPADKWMDIFYDGSPEAHTTMQEYRKQRHRIA